MGHRSRRRHAKGGEADVSLSEVFFSESSSSSSSEPGVDRKSKQVCREVFRVLAQAEPGDPCLLGMSILEVVPAPDASRLAVRVALAPGTDVKEAMAALARWKGGLRGEIAQALQRKRTPELVFEPCGPDAEPEPGEEDWP